MLYRRKPRVGVLGAGAWGTTIAKVLTEAENKVELWCREPEVAQEINESHHNGRFLMGVDLPTRLRATSDATDAASDKDFILLAVPSPYLSDLAATVSGCPGIHSGVATIGILSKGIVDTPQGIRLVTEAAEEHLPDAYGGNIAYISGPSHAEEVARGKMTGLISACPNGRIAIRFRELMSTPPLVVYSSLDVRGVQIAAAVKNVVAIAYGMLDALREFSDRFGDNTESLLLAAGLNEIQRLGLALGATHPETFTSIAGVGDLDVTCRSRYGRNRRFGREVVVDHILSRFNGLDDLLGRIDELGYFPEGVVAARHADALARENGLSLPVCQGVLRILEGRAEPLPEVEAILSGIVAQE